MKKDNLRKYMNITGDMYQPVRFELTAQDIEQTFESAENADNDICVEDVLEQLDRLSFKMKSLRSPQDGEYANGYEDAMTLAATMLDNALARIRGL